MDYARHYYALIGRSSLRPKPAVTESHHIVPRCMGGSDKRSNRADLTPEEHFVAHQLLTKMYPDHRGLAIAAAAMATDKRNGKRSKNKLYGWLRRRAAAATSIAQLGIPCSPEVRAKISASHKASEAVLAHIDSLRGVPRTDDVRAKVSTSHKASKKAKAAREALFARQTGRRRSPETCAKIAKAQVGRTLSREHKAKIASTMKGVPKAAEHIANAALGLKGNSNAKGAVRSPETREKMRQAAIKREASKRAKMLA